MHICSLQSHILLSRYNLSSPAPLAQLWLEILSKVWMFEPTNTSYLMDIVLRTAFFRPELRTIATGILSRLYEVIFQNFLPINFYIDYL